MAKHSVLRATIILFLFYVSTFSEHRAWGRSRFGRFSLRRLRSRLSSLGGLTSSFYASGLFMTQRQVLQLREDRVMSDVFVIESSQVKFPFNGVCELPVDMTEGESMPQCAESPPRVTGENNWFGSTGGCCNTILSVELPQIVTSVITGQRHQVLQFPTSSQLVHSGHCENEGGMCVLGGRCTTVNRIQWLLVRSSPISAPPNSNGVDSDISNDDYDDDGRVAGNAGNLQNRNFFVPTVIHNHCQCIFT